MFELVIKCLSFLKHIPFLPHLFDGLIKIRTLLYDKKILDYIDQIEEKVLSWEKTTSRLHKFGGIQFDVDKKEIGHIHSNGLIDVLLKKEIKDQLVREGRVEERHSIKNSGWLSFRIRNENDKAYALELLEYSYLLKM